MGEEGRGAPPCSRRWPSPGSVGRDRERERGSEQRGEEGEAGSTSIYLVGQILTRRQRRQAKVDKKPENELGNTRSSFGPKRSRPISTTRWEIGRLKKFRVTWPSFLPEKQAILVSLNDPLASTISLSAVCNEPTWKFFLHFMSSVTPGAHLYHSRRKEKEPHEIAVVVKGFLQ